jgi:Ca-activated chloride channel family protein
MRLPFRLAAFVLALMTLSLPAMAASRAIVILDASGSMWAQIDGKARIEIARDTLKEVLAGVPAEVELGFMAYGHRTKGDCKDIELMVPPEAGTADRIIGAAMSLNPRGKTPLTAAVLQAAEELKYTEDAATVVLITDGIETCDADPCALATELESKGVDFTVNVVGFGLSDEEGAKVKCLADDTGGTYISADDEDGLKDAIDVAVNDVPPPKPDEPAPPPSEEPVSDITFDPTAILAEGEDPLVDGDSDIVWEFSKPNADGTAGEWVRTEYHAEYKGAIEPGDYIVTARLDYASLSLPVTIKAGEIAKPEFNLNAGHITLRPIAYEGAEPDSNAAVYTEFPDGTSTTSYGEVNIFVPAGTTKISVSIGAAKLEDTVTVAAGERVTKDIVVGVGHAAVNSFYAEGMKVEDGNIFTEIFGAKKDIQGNRESFGYAYGPDAGFELLPGDYVAVASFDAAKVEQPFTIKAGEATDVSVPLNAGVLFIDAPGAYYIEVLGKKDIQGNRPSFSGVYDVTSNRTLPAGDYHVMVTYEGDKAPKEADAKVTAGERTEIKVE